MIKLRGIHLSGVTGMKDEVYRALAEHLDRMPVGAPMSAELLEILRVLFTPEEARLAAKLPFFNTPLPEIARATGMREDELRVMLDAMASKGTVFRSVKDGVARYRLLPTLVGFSETPFWPGRDDERARRLAPLWIRYLENAWGREIADRELPLVRVVPVEEDVNETSEVLPFETAKELVEGASFRAVAYCPCRQMKAYMGEGCEHERENCFHFGSMGRYIVEHGMGRSVTLEEAVRKLEEAHEAGLVFTVDNYQGKISTLCCCCSCCCVFLHSRRELGFENAVNPSSYVARVDRESCVGCGECEERCPVGAVRLDEHELARVDREECLGCGVCVPNCTGGAVSLRRREKRSGVPTLEEFMSSLQRE
jgi:ferredoxin